MKNNLFDFTGDTYNDVLEKIQILRFRRLGEHPLSVNYRDYSNRIHEAEDLICLECAHLEAECVCFQLMEKNAKRR